MVDIGTCLRHYKRKDVQIEMINASINREIAVKFGDKGFGRRPDTLTYPKDVIEFAKQNATSFHVSEERWINPLLIQTGMKPNELNELRTGFDLVLDIDCKDWKISKIITWLIIEALKKHNIKSISAKFSGNKGFHIGIPFEAFPKEINNTKTSEMFPDLCRNISYYLIDYISKNMIDIDNDEVIFNKHYKFKLDYLKIALEKTKEELIETICVKCNKKIIENKRKKEKFQFICSNCEENVFSSNDYMVCNKCNSIMERKEIKIDDSCSCGSNEIYNVLNASSLIDLDTLLISSRHLYRLVYSLHEKSGLVSIPFDPNKILHFSKEMANPNNLIISEYKFLVFDNSNENETKELIEKTLLSKSNVESLKEKSDEFYLQKKVFNKTNDDEINEIESEIPIDLFPPCIKKILNGLNDGRKRALFILINFYLNTGYSNEKIRELINLWNKKNHEELRQVIINSQLNYRINSKNKIIPPNCDNQSYYKDLGICNPDNFCQRIKNPVNYSILKSKILLNEEKGKRIKLTDEQKEMRKIHRKTKKELN
jgi:hypothetical protein